MADPVYKTIGGIKYSQSRFTLDKKNAQNHANYLRGLGHNARIIRAGTNGKGYAVFVSVNQLRPHSKKPWGLKRV